MSDTRKYDIVVFGATGYTGERAARYLAHVQQRARRTIAEYSNANANHSNKQNIATIISTATTTANYKWAIAGRSEKKLQDVRTRIFKSLSTDISDCKTLSTDFSSAANAKANDAIKSVEHLCSIVVADAACASSIATNTNTNSKNDKEGKETKEEEKAFSTLLDMCKQTKLLINCVGPYRFYGEAVVRACIETRTKYIDVTGEPAFMERMQVEYHSLARSSKVLVVHAAGLDCIPAEFGYLFTVQQFEKKYPNSTLTTIDSVLQSKSTKPNARLRINYTTWESAVHSISNANELKRIRPQLRKLQTEKYGQLPQTAASRAPKLPFYDKRVNKWCTIFPGADSSVVRNAQYALYAHDKDKGLKRSYPSFSAYMAISSTFWMIMMCMFGLFLSFFIRFGCGRKLLLKYPNLFTMGLFTQQNAPPVEAETAAILWNWDFFSRGRTSSSAATATTTASATATATTATATSASLHTRISAYDAYAVTVVGAVQCGMCMLECKDLPIGGVFTCASAFIDCFDQLLPRLQADGIQADVMKY